MRPGSRGTPSHSLPRCVFEKTPLGTLKNFFRGVKAKPDCLLVFRAGTSSRLKRLGLFRSCRREASSKTQGLSEDASHHARKHKTPTEGTAYGVHRSVPENQRFRHPVFFVFQLKICRPSTEKVFGSPPFSKGGAGVQGGALQGTLGAGGALRREPGCRVGALQGTLGCRAGCPAKSIKTGQRAGSTAKSAG